MLDRAARRGAKAALAELGLHDAQAAADINDMRSLIAAWRETRSHVWKTVTTAMTMAVIGFVSMAVWLHFKSLTLR